MKLALLRCCTTSVFLRHYESAANAVLERLEIGIEDIKEFNCCGYPFRNLDFGAYVLLSARNLSLAERKNVSIMTVCNCCYGSMKYANHILREDASIRRETNETLAKEGLRYEGRVEIKHLLEVLVEDIGVARIEERMLQKLKGLKIAAHPGCHILRPRRIVSSRRGDRTSLFDHLIGITGAESVSWREQKECCGAPAWGIDNNLSMDLTEKKITSAKQSGAEFVCVLCPYCQLQFDRVQKRFISERHANYQLPSILYTQLLGLTLGIDVAVLGIEKNELNVSRICAFPCGTEKTRGDLAQPTRQCFQKPFPGRLSRPNSLSQDFRSN